VPQRLRERPLARDRDVDGPGRHRGHPRAGRLPGPLDGAPRLAQAGRVARAPQLAPGEAPVELGVDQWCHVDPVDHEGRTALDEPRGVDLDVVDLHRAHDDAGERHGTEPGTPQVDAEELRARQVVGARERGHRRLLPSATTLAPGADTVQYGRVT